jgi:nucleoside-diphosphate-sugar epimerase
LYRHAWFSPSGVFIFDLVPNSKSKIVFKDLPSDDPMQRKPDISLAHANLDWKPSIPLEQGLIKTIQYFSELIEMNSGSI